jgi:hypothetical protein
LRKFLATLIFSILLVAFIPSLSQSKPAILLIPSSKVELISFDTQLSSSSVQESLEAVDKTFVSIDKERPASAQGRENILGFLRDSIWQFIGSVLAVVAIIISLIIYFLQKSKKSLSYEILSETALLSVAKEVEDKIKILFEGDSVKNVHLILLKISNTGNVSILPSDFLKNITISFDNSTRILSAEISGKKPHSIEAILTIDGTELIISPSLWNSGDTITIKSLVSEFNEEIHVSGRIIGIKDIERLSNSENSSTVILVSLGLISMFINTGLYFLTKQSIFLSLGMISYILSLSPIMFDKEYREAFIKTFVRLVTFR